MANEKSHISTVISSLTKIYEQSKLYGKLHPKDIYILDAVHKLIYECETALTNTDKKSLITLYSRLLHSSKYICATKPYKTYTIVKDSFIQAETKDCNNVPILDLLYYWQEPLGRINTMILDDIATGTYLETKPSDLKSTFVIGKDIDYIDIGVICFALTNVPENIEYHIYDDDDNTDVTLGFESFYNIDLKTRIFISYNIYSYGIMNFKIKQI